MPPRNDLFPAESRRRAEPSPETVRRVVRNSVDREISRSQLNLAESNFTGPMCISGLMHSIPAGPGDEVYLHGIILAPFDPTPTDPLSGPLQSLSLIIRITPAASPLAQSHATIALFEVLRLVAIDQPLRDLAIVTSGNNGNNAT
ncbi:hypothetical protein WN51_13833 [Melipona quadrifasciata]|uniref:Uncharacterized protein n=1 Tax=Melipona quadrifasciata TaxID=166423 RepID=A0A0M8ZYL5_9HYME|nr:hypothetical protein WN51_13833 [Melipona quadrifasciata]